MVINIFHVNLCSPQRFVVYVVGAWGESRTVEMCRGSSFEFAPTPCPVPNHIKDMKKSHQTFHSYSRSTIKVNLDAHRTRNPVLSEISKLISAHISPILNLGQYAPQGQARGMTNRRMCSNAALCGARDEKVWRYRGIRKLDLEG